MTDLQLAPEAPEAPAAPARPARIDDAALRRLLRDSVPDTGATGTAAATRRDPEPLRRPAAGHCRFTLHYED
ncbi:hypothetical protein ACFV4P_14965 [Kitasatospora sp. NPDC059795]|uniref:hypothetical protein n=1 Tax=Kitasatospora sp. NPDC059795 TaxID=3346949 RepID=UPI003646E7FF